ncbi:MAG TPA: TIGR04255 family protein [Azospira sp.]|nr:TIGR04255 family protein [Azospira sp.]
MKTALKQSRIVQTRQTKRWEMSVTAAKKKYAKICYTKTYLKDVILRVDFAAPVGNLVKKRLPGKLTKAALSRFPVAESQKITAQELQFSASGSLSSNSREETQWTFHGNEREKNIVIAPQFLVMRHSAYKSYEELADDFFCVFGTLAEIESDLVISRIGLRYINVISIDDGNPLDWNEYIADSLLGIINSAHKKQNLSRSFHVLEYAFENINLKCQFGIANPDYPAAIRRRQFVIDMDAYSVTSHDTGTLRDVIDESHEFIQDFFESAITSETRKLMKSKK